MKNFTKERVFVLVLVSGNNKNKVSKHGSEKTARKTMGIKKQDHCVIICISSSGSENVHKQVPYKHRPTGSINTSTIHKGRNISQKTADEITEEVRRIHGNNVRETANEKRRESDPGKKIPASLRV